MRRSSARPIGGGALSSASSNSGSCVCCGTSSTAPTRLASPQPCRRRSPPPCENCGVERCAHITRAPTRLQDRRSCRGPLSRYPQFRVAALAIECVAVSVIQQHWDLTPTLLVLGRH